MKKLPILLLFGSLLYSQSCAPIKTVAKTTKNEDISRSSEAIAKLEEGKTLYNTKCQRCHGLYNTKAYTAAEWRVNVNAMSQKARLVEGEKEAIYNYLAANAK